MRLLAVACLTVLACGSSTETSRDASMDRAPCEAAYQLALDRSCSVPGDCALVDHQDCCGIVKIGVHAGSETAAAAAESTYAACFDCGARGCAHPDLDETGTAPRTGQAIVATCVANRCTSIVQ